MKKHPYHYLVAVLRKQRNNIIEDFRHFKRDRVNRKWVSHSAFSHTVNHFRKKLAEIDKLIAGGKLAIKVSKETDVIHWYDYQSNSVYSETRIPSQYTAK